MKLAEALSIRKDLQKRIDQLNSRIVNNMKVQEGEAPSEEPQDLFVEADRCLAQLEELIYKINATNMKTIVNGKPLTKLMAEREVLNKKIAVYRDAFNRATEGRDRYSRSEIKFITTVDVKTLGKTVDSLSARLRALDVEIQSINFATELVE